MGSWNQKYQGLWPGSHLLLCVLRQVTEPLSEQEWRIWDVLRLPGFFCSLFFFFCFVFVFGLFAISRAAPVAYGDSQAKGLVGAVASGQGSNPQPHGS